jgi:uncharacterized OB-fold protein
VTAAPDQRPLPKPNYLSQPFWDACRQHRLTVQRCRECGGYIFPPQDFCRFCFSDRLEWAEASGRGTVYSFTVIWRPQTPAFQIPYVAAIVDLAEGYQMVSNVVDCPWQDVRVGLPVEVTFEDRSETISLPVFRPSSG